MRSSLQLGTLFGIPVYLHWTFLLLLGFVALSTGMSGVVLVLAIFACVVLHEFGHALAARRYGIGTRDVTLLPIGGVARLERMPDDPRQELVVALAGPAVNIAIAGLLGIWLVLAGIGAGIGLSLTGGSFVARLLSINLVLVLFNLLPRVPDGRRARAARAAGPAHGLRRGDGPGSRDRSGYGGALRHRRLAVEPDADPDRAVRVDRCGTGSADGSPPRGIRRPALRPRGPLARLSRRELKTAARLPRRHPEAVPSICSQNRR